MDQRKRVPQARRLILFKVEGDDTMWKYDATEQWVKAAMEEYEIDVGKEPYFLIPKQCAYLQTVPYKGNVQMCTYNATADYIQSILGMKLSPEDADWFRHVSFTESGGVPQNLFISTIHELVRPYGLGVTHVWVRPGSAGNAEQDIFMSELGVNPLAAADHVTSNEQALEKLELDGLNPGWRFEFGDPEPPCIVSATFTQTQWDTEWGSYYGGGHTLYVPPRGRITNDWRVAVRVGRNAPSVQIEYDHDNRTKKEYVPSMFKKKSGQLLVGTYSYPQTSYQQPLYSSLDLCSSCGKYTLKQISEGKYKCSNCSRSITLEDVTCPQCQIVDIPELDCGILYCAYCGAYLWEA